MSFLLKVMRRQESLCATEIRPCECSDLMQTVIIFVFP